MAKDRAYLLGKDAGHVRKIAFINSDCEEFKTRELGKIMPIIEASGNGPKYYGFLASAPTIYLYLSSFHKTNFETFYKYQGSLYQRHHCQHSDIVVYCHVAFLAELQQGSVSSVKELMTEFPRGNK